VARWRRRKALSIAAYLASTAVLLVVPVTASPKLLGTADAAMAALVAAWCLYHLLEYVASVALWSWLGDLTPRRVRGRLLGQRERWLVAGRIGGIVGSASLAVLWARLLPDARRWEPLALSAAAGALLMMAAVVPLAMMPAVEDAASARPQAPWRTLARALVDRPYRRLIAFACWFSIVNGLTASAQEMYPIYVLGVPYAGMLSLRGLMRAGQSAVAPRMGRLVDRWGNRPVMIVAQLLVAAGPLFFLAATPERPWLLAGAFVVWVAYAGLNVGLDNIKLKLAPEDNNAPYLAVYQAASDLANGLAIVAGGALLDRLRAGGTEAMTLYANVFLAGWIGRTLAVVLLARLVEPGARRLADLARGR
jgi:MFS family permease